jgi:hypothetical protein
VPPNSDFKLLKTIFPSLKTRYKMDRKKITLTKNNTIAPIKNVKNNLELKKSVFPLRGLINFQ